MLVNFVVMLTILLGCCSLALDVGMMELKRLQLQNAADAAAMGAMMEAERGNSDWVSAGQNDSTLNGFTNGVNGVTVAIAEPPADGPFATNWGAFRATVTQPVTALFLGKTISIQAQATALMPPCGYMMATSTSYSTLWLQSAGFLAMCPVYVSQIMTVDGFSTAGYVAYYVEGAAIGSGGGGRFQPPPIYGYPQMTDPLSYVVSPAFSSCTPADINMPTITTPTYLNPGTYCNTAGNPGLSIGATTVTFNPGLYIITGGISVNGGTLNGSNVTLYMTKRTDISVSPAYGTLSFYNNAQVNLCAPNANYGDGSVTAVLIFGDRNWVPTGVDDISLQQITWNGDGIIYFPKAGIYAYNSQAYPSHYFALVVDNVHEFFGDLHLSSNYTQVQGGNPFRPRESLVE